MNLAANQAMYPQTATHMSYPNGAILQSPLQQPSSIVKRILFSFYLRKIRIIFIRRPILIWVQLVRLNRH